MRFDSGAGFGGPANRVTSEDDVGSMLGTHLARLAWSEFWRSSASAPAVADASIAEATATAAAVAATLIRLMPVHCEITLISGPATQMLASEAVLICHLKGWQTQSVRCIELEQQTAEEDGTSQGLDRSSCRQSARRSGEYMKAGYHAYPYDLMSNLCL